MNTVTVIGYGNPLRGDDGLGECLAGRLAAIFACARKDKETGTLEVLTAQQLTPELAEPVSRSQLVLFIDASRMLAPGQWSLSPVEPEPLAGPSTHHLSPSALLTLARMLSAGGPWRAMLFSVGGASFSCGENLSPAVTGRLPVLEETLARIIRRELEA